MNAATAQVHLEIEVGSEPISGWLVSAHGDRHPFSGWIELAEAVEYLRQRGSLAARSRGWRTSVARRTVAEPMPGAGRQGL